MYQEHQVQASHESQEERMQGPLSLDKIRDKPYVVVSDDV